MSTESKRSTVSPDDEGGYVHDPDRTDDEGSEGPVHPADVDREFDWRGWTLLAVVFVAFVVSPLAIYLYPPGAYGYLFALIVFPLLPAVVLAITAVWATTRP